MRKILLVGELSDIVQSLSECLSTRFQVQLCSGDLENVKAVHKIAKPDMAVVCQIGMQELDVEIIKFFADLRVTVPVLVISTKERWEEIAPYCDIPRFDHMFRPVTNSELLAKCGLMLDMSVDCVYIASGRKKKRVLIVDDSPIVLRNIKTLLSDMYDVLLAQSGERALDIMKEEHPNLVLLDYQMPGIDGKETFEAILADEEIRDIPIIFLTNVDEKSKVMEVLKSLPCGYVLKPPDKEELLHMIRENIL